MTEGKTRVLIDALSARQGGGQTYLINLLRDASIYGGVEVFLLAHESLALPAGIPITRLPVHRCLENPFVRACWQRLVLPMYLRRLSPDILFCPGGVISRGVPESVKVVVTFQNMLPFDLPATRKYPLGYQRLRIWLLRRLMMKDFERADLVICISNYARTVLDDVLKGPLCKTVVIPHGVACEFQASHQAALKRPAWLQDYEYFLYVSTYDFYKAQIEVVRGFAEFRKTHKRDYRLVLTGPENRAYGQRLRMEIARLGLGESVILSGPIPYGQLPALYRHAAINIFASEVENCPNILMEMMASGRPAVVSNRLPMPEFGGEAVCYFDPAKPSELADKLRLLLENKSQMETLGRLALERSKLFDWREAARFTWEAILGVAA